MVWAANNFGSLRWRVMPRQPDNASVALRNVETDTGLMNEITCTAMPLMVFTDDHRSDTIDRVIAAVKKFRADNKVFDENFKVKLEKAKAASAAAEMNGEIYTPSDAINFRLATGNVGVAAATNDEVRASKLAIVYGVYLAVFVMCLISFRNPLAALCITLPLVLVTALGEALMTKLGIGLKVNTLTVIALGVGIGVDYAIYIYARMAELMKQGKPLSQAYFEALKTTGIAIFYTALTLAAGVATWMFSALKFQADMGILLTFMFVVNMIAAMIFLPALCRWFMRPGEKA
jgi:predicted RND superfamily exporter protein